VIKLSEALQERKTMKMFVLLRALNIAKTARILTPWQAPSHVLLSGGPALPVG
jgi:hypothetical protein